MKITTTYEKANAVAIRVRGAEAARKVVHLQGFSPVCVQFVKGGYADVVFPGDAVPASLMVGAAAGWFKARAVRVEK